ncbi:MAG TPA: ROK family protein [Bryobacteraceae bacterium]|nr:ROK family protein [Bryobacteraceae bacterium]
MFGAIEAGGTKFVVGVGTGPDDLRTVRIPTAEPASTIAAAIAFLREAGGGKLQAVGIGSFGPICTDRRSPRWGYITSTPKTAWRDCDLAGPVQRALGIPAGFDTDVNAAALGEARWGAARDGEDSVYLTVGTGIGGGAIVAGRLVHGTSHPEMGHIRLPHDDSFPGVCPYHGDCLEGMASGSAIHARWGKPAEELPEDHPAWVAEARYLALAVVNFAAILSTRRVILGGGVMRHAQLYPAIRNEVARLLNHYIGVPEIVAPELGDRAGVCGALALAMAGQTGDRPLGLPPR